MIPFTDFWGVSFFIRESCYLSLQTVKSCYLSLQTVKSFNYNLGQMFLELVGQNYHQVPMTMCICLSNVHMSVILNSITIDDLKNLF